MIISFSEVVQYRVLVKKVFFRILYYVSSVRSFISDGNMQSQESFDRYSKKGDSLIKGFNKTNVI